MSDRESATPERRVKAGSPNDSARSYSSSPKQRKHSPSRSRSREDRSRSYTPKRRRSHSRSPGSTRRRHLGDRENPEPSRCLGIFGLSLFTQTRHLREVFAKYGSIDEITIVTDAQSGRSRGFAFVYYERIEDAERAKEECNGIEIDHRKIRVDYSITKRPHTPTPGMYMGRPSQPDRFSRRSRGRRGGYGYYDRYDDRREYRGRDYGRDDYYREDYRRDDYRRSPDYGRRYKRSRSRSYSPREREYNGGRSSYRY